MLVTQVTKPINQASLSGKELTMVALAGRWGWDTAKRLCGFVLGGLMIGLSILSLISCLTNIWNPVVWMSVIWAVWMLFFGLLTMLLQLNWGELTITRYAGFLDLTIGRTLFYMFCGK